MASSFAAGYADEEDGSLSGINVTPLVDVTLVLLIVFMITVPAIVSSARLKVDLPETSTVAADAEQVPLAFTLKRHPSGPILLYLNNASIDEAGVRGLFSQSIDRNSDRPVSLSADRGIEYGEVVRVVDLLESLGVHKLSLDTRHVERQ